MYQGIINNVNFKVESEESVLLWLPEKTTPEDFRYLSTPILQYLVNEGFINKKCKVKIVKSQS